MAGLVLVTLGCLGGDAVPAAEPVDRSYGWTQVVGTGLPDSAVEVASVADGYVVTGVALGFSESAPPMGIAEAWSSASDEPRIYVAKLDLGGTLVWGRMFGAARVETRPGLAVAPDGSIYVASNMPTEQIRDGDGLLIGVQIPWQLHKLSGEGELLWSQEEGYGASGFDPRLAATSDSELIVLRGDVLPAEPQRTAVYPTDATLVRLDGQGTVIWERSWPSQSNAALAIADDGSIVTATAARGGPLTLTRHRGESGEAMWSREWSETGWDLAATPHRGRVAVAGDRIYLAATRERGTLLPERDVMDFDPGEGEDLLDASGGGGFFLVALDLSGGFVWARSWSVEDPRSFVEPGKASALAIGDSSIYLGGSFINDIDFNPGPPEDSRSAIGEDAFVIRLDQSGSYLGTRLWGGIEDDAVVALALRGDSVIAAGSFKQTVDFSPAEGQDPRQAVAHSDGFITAFAFADATDQPAPPPLPDPPECSTLDGTGLPDDFDGCVAAGGNTYGFDENETCRLDWCEGDALYDACADAGGGISIVDAPEPYQCCDVVYPRFQCPCLGNFCD